MLVLSGGESLSVLVLSGRESLCWYCLVGNHCVGTVW